MEELIYVPTTMKAMPKSCSECDQQRKSHFCEGKAVCHAAGRSVANHTDSRPLWCPLKEVKI